MAMLEHHFNSTTLYFCLTCITLWNLLIQGKYATPLHDGLVAQVDVDTQEGPNRVIAALNIMLSLFLEQQKSKKTISLPLLYYYYPGFGKY